MLNGDGWTQLFSLSLSFCFFLGSLTNQKNIVCDCYLWPNFTVDFGCAIPGCDKWTKNEIRLFALNQKHSNHFLYVLFFYFASAYVSIRLLKLFISSDCCCCCSFSTHIWAIYPYIEQQQQLLLRRIKMNVIISKSNYFQSCSHCIHIFFYLFSQQFEWFSKMNYVNWMVCIDEVKMTNFRIMFFFVLKCNAKMFNW